MLPDPEQSFAAAVAHHLAGRLDQAAAGYGQVLALCPDHAEALNNLGHLCMGRGQLAEAIALYQRALCADPGHVLARVNLGGALLRRGRPADLDEAAVRLREAVALDPGCEKAHNNLGSVLRRLGRAEEALLCHQRALHLKPDHASAHNNLGLLRWEGDQHAAALRHFRVALAIDPRFTEAYCNLAGPLLAEGDVEEALRCYRTALALQPDLPAAHHGLLLGLHYSDRVSAEEVSGAHQRFGATFSGLAPVSVSATPRPRAPERRLRVGYVSPDLRTHSVAFFLAPLLAAHDRRGFEVICYASVARPDAMTARLRGLADGWRDVRDLSDEELFAQVRGDEIDILVDLAGHTTGTRLLCFARRAAPVQVTYLGYPDTTGLSTMDVRFTDAWADPPGQTEHLHAEALWRLPHGFLCYEPPAEAPEVGPLPAGQGRPVTFISCNNRPKLSPSALATWGALLAAVPGSRLILKSAGFADEGARARLRAAWTQNGGDAGRLDLRPLSPGLLGHLRVYQEADLALDTFPYHGTTTTCEALWMGVPVVTLAGATHAARVGVSLLQRVGLPDLIAQSPAEYVALAAGLALDPGRLAGLRQGLRERLRASSLCDARLVTGSIEEAYRHLWRRACEQAGAEDSKAI